MDLPEDFPTMAPEHREHFERMRNLVARLTEELQQAHDTAAADRLQAATTAAKLRAELCARADVIIRLTMREADQRSAARRSAAEVVQLVRALRDLANAFKPRSGPAVTVAEVNEMIRAHHAAQEVLKVIDIPF